MSRSSCTGDGSQQSQQSMPFDNSGYCKAHPEVKLAEKIPLSKEWKVVSGVCPRCCASAVMACKQSKPMARQQNEPRKSSDLPCSVVDADGSSRSLISTITNPFDALLAKKPPGKQTTDNSQQTQPTVASSCPSTPASMPKPRLSFPATPDSATKPAFSDRYFTAANRDIVGLALDIVESERLGMVGSLGVTAIQAWEERSWEDVDTRSWADANSYSYPNEPPGRHFDQC